MKAILLAGGEGTRLRPLTAKLPKPMVPLFGRPVLEHLLLLLRRHGINQAAVTLGYLPQAVTDYFGDGSAWGMSLTYLTEETPLGTAGAVRACRDFLAGEDCIVLSGDCVCDFDLTACIRLHQRRRAEATLLLHRMKDPLEYGLVLTDDESRVTRFVEKPGWSQVFTDQVNTGIYLLQNSVLDEIPAGEAWDFSRDLFPRMLQEGRALYGDLPRGYWRDMGDSRAYLRTLADALEGRVELELTHPQLRDKLWSASILPEDALILPPCWIGSDVTFGKDCLIGPYAVLEDGTRVGDGAVLQRSALLGSEAGARSTLYGAILCSGASAGPESLLNEHTVLGDGARLGRGAILQEYVSVWPGLSVPAGARVNASLTAEGDLGLLRFDGDGVIRGTLGRDLTPSLLLRLGGLLAQEGKCGLGWGGGSGAKSLALAAAGGITAAGGDVLFQDGSTPAVAAWCAGAYELPVSLYLWQQGDALSLYLFDRTGLPLSLPRQRRLESRLLAGEARRVTAEQVGRERRLDGMDALCAEAAAQAGSQAPIPPYTLSVPETGPEAEQLAASLERLGCKVLRREVSGQIACYSRRGGLGLSLREEGGRLLPPEVTQLLALLLLLEQGEKTLALPPSAPALADRLVKESGALLLRLGRDGTPAAECARRLLPLRDSCAAACLIAAHLAETGQSLARLAARLPQVALYRQELPLTEGRAQAMEQLSKAFPQAEDMGEGLRIRLGEGWVWLAPMAGRSALQLQAEASSQEFAAELCEIISQKVKNKGRL